MKIRFYNCRILTMEEKRPVFRGEIWVEDERILSVLEDSEDKAPVLGEGTEGKYIWDEEIDCEDNLLMPGFKNAHTHSAMTLMRSLADDCPLQEWLEGKIFPLEAKLTDTDIYAGAKLAVLEYLTSGVTGIFDMYINPEAVSQACGELGMCVVHASGLNNFTQSPAQMEELFCRLNEKDSLNQYRMGIHAEYTCSKELLEETAKLAQKYKTPVYMHLSETEKEVAECKARYGMTPTELFDSLGLFEYGGGGYHCIHLTEHDKEIFKEKGLYVITCPGSNTKLASGIAPIADYLERGIPVAIGTDGASSNNCLDMFREMFLVTGLAKLREKDASAVDAREVLKMATVNGAKAMGLLNSDVLASGKYADMILIDLKQPNMQPILNIEKNLVYSGSKQNVKLTMIHGKVLYRDNQFFVGETKESIYKEVERVLERIL